MGRKKLYCNKNLKENNEFHAQIVQGDFVGEYRWNQDYPFFRYPEEYEGQEVMKLCCSQHSCVVDGVETISDSQRKKITASWTKYLSTNTLPIKTVQVCTRMSQDVFDALCTQTSIETLRIKVFTGKQVNQITKLTNLKKLFIESATSLESIEPIAELSNLEVLIIGNTKKIRDYRALGKLKKVKVFSICSYITQENIIHMESDAFMYEMEALEYVDMCEVRVENQTYLTPENVKDLKLAMFYI